MFSIKTFLLWRWLQRPVLSHAGDFIKIRSHVVTILMQKAENPKTVCVVDLSASVYPVLANDSGGCYGNSIHKYGQMFVDLLTCEEFKTESFSLQRLVTVGEREDRC